MERIQLIFANHGRECPMGESREDALGVNLDRKAAFEFHEIKIGNERTIEQPNSHAKKRQWNTL